MSQIPEPVRAALAGMGCPVPAIDHESLGDLARDCDRLLARLHERQWLLDQRESEIARADRSTSTQLVLKELSRRRAQVCAEIEHYVLKVRDTARRTEVATQWTNWLVLATLAATFVVLLATGALMAVGTFLPRLTQRLAAKVPDWALNAVSWYGRGELTRAVRLGRFALSIAIGTGVSVGAVSALQSLQMRFGNRTEWEGGILGEAALEGAAEIALADPVARWVLGLMRSPRSVPLRVLVTVFTGAIAGAAAGGVSIAVVSPIQQGVPDSTADWQRFLGELGMGAWQGAVLGGAVPGLISGLDAVLPDAPRSSASSAAASAELSRSDTTGPQPPETSERASHPVGAPHLLPARVSSPGDLQFPPLGHSGREVSRDNASAPWDGWLRGDLADPHVASSDDNRGGATSEDSSADAITPERPGHDGVAPVLHQFPQPNPVRGTPFEIHGDLLLHRGPTDAVYERVEREIPTATHPSLIDQLKHKGYTPLADGVLRYPAHGPAEQVAVVNPNGSLYGLYRPLQLAHSQWLLRSGQVEVHPIHGQRRPDLQVHQWWARGEIFGRLNRPSWVEFTATPTLAELGIAESSGLAHETVARRCLLALHVDTDRVFLRELLAEPDATIKIARILEYSGARAREFARQIVRVHFDSMRPFAAIVPTERGKSADALRESLESAVRDHILQHPEQLIADGARAVAQSVVSALRHTEVAHILGGTHPHYRPEFYRAIGLDELQESFRCFLQSSASPALRELEHEMLVYEISRSQVKIENSLDIDRIIQNMTHQRHEARQHLGNVLLANSPDFTHLDEFYSTRGLLPEGIPNALECISDNKPEVLAYLNQLVERSSKADGTCAGLFRESPALLDRAILQVAQKIETDNIERFGTLPTPETQAVVEEERAFWEKASSWMMNPKQAAKTWIVDPAEYELTLLAASNVEPGIDRVVNQLRDASMDKWREKAHTHGAENMLEDFSFHNPRQLSPHPDIRACLENSGQYRQFGDLPQAVGSVNWLLEWVTNPDHFLLEQLQRPKHVNNVLTIVSGLDIPFVRNALHDLGASVYGMAQNLGIHRAPGLLHSAVYPRASEADYEVKSGAVSGNVHSHQLEDAMTLLANDEFRDAINRAETTLGEVLTYKIRYLVLNGHAQECAELWRREEQDGPAALGNALSLAFEMQALAACQRLRIVARDDPGFRWLQEKSEPEQVQETVAAQLEAHGTDSADLAVWRQLLWHDYEGDEPGSASAAAERLAPLELAERLKRVTAPRDFRYYLNPELESVDPTELHHRIDWCAENDPGLLQNYAECVQGEPGPWWMRRLSASSVIDDLADRYSRELETDPELARKERLRLLDNAMMRARLESDSRYPEALTGLATRFPENYHVALAPITKPVELSHLLLFPEQFMNDVVKEYDWALQTEHFDDA